MMGCGVFLDDTHFMVIGGQSVWHGTASGHVATTYDDTFILDITANSWSTGPKMSIPRTMLTCNLITDGDGNKKVITVGGNKIEGGNPTPSNGVEIYDVTSQTWSLGKSGIIA